MHRVQQQLHVWASHKGLKLAKVKNRLQECYIILHGIDDLDIKALEVGNTFLGQVNL